MKQNHLTMKYRSPAILRSVTRLDYTLIILKYVVHARNALQDMKQNYQTVRYRSVGMVLRKILDKALSSRHK